MVVCFGWLTSFTQFDRMTTGENRLVRLHQLISILTQLSPFQFLPSTCWELGCFPYRVINRLRGYSDLGLGFYSIKSLVYDGSPTPNSCIAKACGPDPKAAAIFVVVNARSSITPRATPRNTWHAIIFVKGMYAGSRMYRRDGGTEEDTITARFAKK